MPIRFSANAPKTRPNALRVGRVGAVVYFALAACPASADTLWPALAPLIPAATATAAAADTDDTETFSLADAPAPQVPFGPPAPPPDATPTIGKVQLKKFKRIHWSPGENVIKADGAADIEYTRASDKFTATLTANNLNYDFGTGLVKASGGVRLKREGGVFTGQQIEFDLANDVGFVTEAKVDSEFFVIEGKRIEAKPKKTYQVTDGSFTTCERYHHDYRIEARSITIVANKYVTARKIGFYLGSTRLISLPSYRRDLTHTTGVAAPRVGYSKAEGLNARYASQLIGEPRRTLDLDARFGLKYPFIGFLAFRQDLRRTPPGLLPPLNRAADLTNPLRGVLEQLSPPTFDEYTEGRYPVEIGPRITAFGVLQSRQQVFNRNRYDLLLSRYPEIGLNFANLLGHTPPDLEEAGAVTPDGNATNTGFARQRIPNAPFLLDASVAYGNIFETPTRVQTSRFATRINVASQPLLIGKRISLRFGATNFLNYYGTGSVYNLFSPEADLNYLPTKTSLFGIGYRYETDLGKTPFTFDRRDATQQLSLRYQVGGPWAFGIQAGYELQHFGNYETQVALVRNFDCMQIGLSYRFRAESLNIIFNLLPPTANRARARREPIPDIQPAPK